VNPDKLVAPRGATRAQAGAVAQGLDSVRDDYFGLDVASASAVFRQAVESMRVIASTRAHVLIEGETGTGKELAARTIHYAGPRRSWPFVPVNCGALPDTLLESELFGHTRGAYTDAREASPGLVAHAQGGTLFLDEIECLSLKAQATLLRFLQSGEYRAVGSQKAVVADVRIIAASNRDLAELVHTGGFRQDLLYRLQVMTLTMPPLRERGDDVALLARSFIGKFEQEYGTQPVVLDPAAGAAMQAYAWPGNVRELENLIHREFLMARDGVLRIHLPGGQDGVRTPAVDGCGWFGEKMLSLPLQEAKALALAQFERAYLLGMITASGWNVASAARRSGKERRAFGKLLKKHGIERRCQGA
jgi:two-component system, NtrC family, response regulator GlrR